MLGQTRLCGPTLFSLRDLTCPCSRSGPSAPKGPARGETEVALAQVFQGEVASQAVEYVIEAGSERCQLKGNEDRGRYGGLLEAIVYHLCHRRIWVEVPMLIQLPRR
jgi:hypothetical protein